MLSYDDVVEWVPPAALLLSGFLLGLVIDAVLLSRLRAMAKRTPWRFDEIFLAAIGRMPVLWLGIAGAYLSLLGIPVPLRASVLTLARDALFVLAALSITIVAAKFAVGFVQLYADRVEGVLPSTSIFTNLVKLLVFLLGILIILQSLGISVTPLLTALGVGGLAVALALQDTLSNLFSGFQIIASRHVRPGDYVKLDSGEEGYVEDITWRITTIRAIHDPFMVMVPNAKVASAIVTNYHQPERQMAIFFPVGVSYDSDLERVERVTREVAREVMTEVAGGVPEFDPLIRYHTFNDFSIDFNVILRGQEFADQFLLKHEFVKRLHARYKRENIEIPFPIRTVFMRGTEGDA